MATYLPFLSRGNHFQTGESLPRIPGPKWSNSYLGWSAPERSGYHTSCLFFQWSLELCKFGGCLGGGEVCKPRLMRPKSGPDFRLDLSPSLIVTEVWVERNPIEDVGGKEELSSEGK